MIRYATRLPPNTSTKLLNNGLVRKTEHFGMEGSIEFMVALLEHLIKNPDPLVVRVYDYSIIQEKKHESIISYDMMRCGILDQDEKDFVDCVGEAWDKYGKEVWSKFSEGACGSFQEPLRSYRAQQPELADFLTQVVTQGRYLDLHSGNVMRNEDADFVLIDLEGFVRLPLGLKENNWISR